MQTTQVEASPAVVHDGIAGAEIISVHRVPNGVTLWMRCKHGNLRMVQVSDSGPVITAVTGACCVLV